MASSTITLWPGLFQIAGCLVFIITMFYRNASIEASDLGLHCFLLFFAWRGGGGGGGGERGDAWGEGGAGRCGVSSD